MAYVKPVRPVIVIRAEKAEEFSSIIVDEKKRRKEKELLALFRANTMKKEK